MTYNLEFFSEIQRNVVSGGNSVRSCGMWSVSNAGMVRYHVLSQNSLSALDTCPSLCIPGCMKSVSAGANGIVWSLAQDGAVYSFSPDFNFLSGSVLNFSAVQQTNVVREIYEYQQSAFMRGFVAYRGRSKDGITAWMEGSNSVSGLYEKLGSREWKWIDSKWRVIDTDKYEDGWTYSENIDGVYSKGKQKKASARRRTWQRRARFECRGPWLAIEAPAIRCVEVQKAEADRILVWAVTMNGEILIRQGVTAAHPQGTTWKHIICDYNIEAISVASPTCVWATTVDGRLLRRECSDQTDIECVGKMSRCLALPKATYVSIDGEDRVYCCDGTRIIKLEKVIENTERTGRLEFRISEMTLHGSYAQFCFV
uniref:Peroxin/Ferlin domain-containing protein n=1 Tax=Angiostrongylus cantonensis TaxID=6313 RepID=A0A0K0DHZ5_ANGCA